MAVADVATFSLLHRLRPHTLAATCHRRHRVGQAGPGGPRRRGVLLLASTLGIRWALALAGLPLPAVVVIGRKLLHRLDSSASERTNILAVLHGVAFLEPLDMAALESLAARVTRLSVPAGTDIVRQGDEGDRFYVVRAGIADVFVDGFCVGSVEPGGYFGERALLRNVPRMATVRSREPMDLLVLPQADFLAALTGQVRTVTTPPEGRAYAGSPGSSLNVTPAARSPAACQPSVASRCKLASRSRGPRRDRTLGRGRLHLRRGEEGDRFYVLLEGRAIAEGAQAVSELRPGDQFGEIALLYGVTRRVDVTAASWL